MPQSIPKGLTRESVLAALAELDAGIEHPFGAPTGYVLVHHGKHYPPKAAIGLACRSFLGRVLLPEEFSGGEALGQANFGLRELGFVVEKRTAGMGIEVAEASREAACPWSRVEVDLIVADFFAILRAEFAGKPYRKADHNRALQPLLDGRSVHVPGRSGPPAPPNLADRCGRASPWPTTLGSFGYGRSNWPPAPSRQRRFPPNLLGSGRPRVRPTVFQDDKGQETRREAALELSVERIVVLEVTHRRRGDHAAKERVCGRGRQDLPSGDMKPAPAEPQCARSPEKSGADGRHPWTS